MWWEKTKTHFNFHASCRSTWSNYVAFEFITAVSMKSTVIHDVASSMSADRYYKSAASMLVEIAAGSSKIYVHTTASGLHQFKNPLKSRES